MKLISKGLFRVVYLYDKKTVLKNNIDITKQPSEYMEKRMLKYANNDINYNANLNEWNNWLKVKGTKWEKYFCPCIEYRKDKSLLMLKAEPMPHDYPGLVKNKHNRFIYNKFPSVFHLETKKIKNIGILDGRVVCFDYQYPLKLGG